MVWLRTLILLLAACTGYAAIAGRISAAGGDWQHLDATGAKQPTTINATVQVGDVIVTGDKGWAVVALLDGGSLTLKPGSHLRVDDYRFHPEQPGNSRTWFTLLRGVLRSVTGYIASSNHAAYQVNTPTVTIGIRGTDHEVMVLDKPADAATPAGTYDHVYSGETVVHHPQGDLVLHAGQNGYAPVGGGKPAQLQVPPKLFDRLERFSADNGIDAALGKLHDRNGDGFGARPLTPDQRDQLQQKVQDIRNGRGDADGAQPGNRASVGQEDKPGAPPADKLPPQEVRQEIKQEIKADLPQRQTQNPSRPPVPTPPRRR